MKYDHDHHHPRHSKKGEATLKRLRSFCLALPEVNEVISFGHPVWKAGKKNFCELLTWKGRLQVAFKTDMLQQELLAKDPRFVIPPYIGHRGWLYLDVEEKLNWREIENHVTASYRSVALKRMLQAMVTNP